MLTTFPAHQARSHAMLPLKLVPLVSQIPQRVCGGDDKLGQKSGGRVYWNLFFAIFFLNMTFFQAYF